MRKTLFFYARKGWDEDFNKGSVWTYPTEIPDLYVSKEHIKALNPRDWKEISKDLSKWFVKVKVTIVEDTPNK